MSTTRGQRQEMLLRLQGVLDLLKRLRSKALKRLRSKALEEKPRQWIASHDSQIGVAYWTGYLDALNDGEKQILRVFTCDACGSQHADPMEAFVTCEDCGAQLCEPCWAPCWALKRKDHTGPSAHSIVCVDTVGCQTRARAATAAAED